MGQISPADTQGAAYHGEDKVGNVVDGEVLETKYAGQWFRFAYVHLLTQYAALGRWEVVRVFWKAMLFCMILNWAALNNGVRTPLPCWRAISYKGNSSSNRYPEVCCLFKPSSTKWPISVLMVRRPSAPRSSPTSKGSLKCPKPSECSREVTSRIALVGSKSLR